MFLVLNFVPVRILLIKAGSRRQQYCTEYSEPSSPVVSTSLQNLFSTQIGIGPAVMLTMMMVLHVL
eukprot:COSAG02_NODE_3248_length_7097_cov_2.679194_10_plen_66_part_00